MVVQIVYVAFNGDDHDALIGVFSSTEKLEEFRMNSGVDAWCRSLVLDEPVDEYEEYALVGQ